MRKMWIQLKPDCDEKRVLRDLEEIGRIEKDAITPGRIILTFHNQTEAGIKMSCFKLQEDFIHFFQDFDMVHT